MNILDTFSMYLDHSFVRYAILVGTLIALCSSLIGVTLVLKRLSFIGDGLSHVAFGAMAIAAVLNLSDNMILTMPVTILSAILLLRRSKKSKVKGDAVLAMISVTSLAFGYLIMNIFSASANVSGDVCTTLFGSTSILTLTKAEVLLSVILSTIVLLAFILFYHRIFDVTFDEDFAKAVGTDVSKYNLIISIIIAIIIVLGMRLVGSLLISALIVFPALSSMRVFSDFKKVTISSVIISVVGAFAGLVISICAGSPVGATIVGIDALIFGIFSFIGRGKSV